MALIARAQGLNVQAAADAAGPADPPLRRAAFPALGAVCELRFAAPGGDEQAGAFEREAAAWIEAFEARVWRLRPGSAVSRINAAAGGGWVDVDAETEALLGLCDSFHFMTGGVYDPTMGPLARLWEAAGEETGEQSGGATARVDEAVLASVRRKAGWSKVLRAPGRVRLQEPGACLDLGGLARPHAIDRVAEMGRTHGLPALLVTIGRGWRGLGAPPGRTAWSVDVEGDGGGRDCGGGGGDGGGGGGGGRRERLSLALRDRALAWSRLSPAVIDPRTGRPVANGCVQATVIAPTCLQAGLLATAALILGPERGLELIRALPGAEALIERGPDRFRSRGFADCEGAP